MPRVQLADSIDVPRQPVDNIGAQNNVGRDQYNLNFYQRRNSFLRKFKEGISLSWDIPASDTLFIERSALFNALTYHQGKGVISACIGMGGTGKTQLALHYIRQSSCVFKAWFSAETVSLLEQSYLDFAKAMGFEEDKPTRAQTIAYVKEKLSTHQSWLLVFDNVENYDSVQAFLPEGGHIILTTRYQRWPLPINTVPVDNMAPEEAIRLLESFTGTSSPDSGSFTQRA